MVCLKFWSQNKSPFPAFAAQTNFDRLSPRLVFSPSARRSEWFDPTPGPSPEGRGALRAGDRWEMRRTVASRKCRLFAGLRAGLELSDTREKPQVGQLPRLRYILSSGQMTGNGSIMNFNAFFSSPPDKVEHIFIFF